MKYRKIRGIDYISLKNFSSLSKNIKINVIPLSLIAELSYGRHMVRVQEGKNFYIRDGEQYNISHPPIYTDGKLYLPKELVEELFAELSLPVSYNLEKDRVNIRNEKEYTKNFSLDFIYLDPGHGGRDPGARGGNFREKNITLSLSKFLAVKLKKSFPGTKIYLSRSKDQYISLEKRSEFANRKINKNKNGIFLSMHCNSTFSVRSHGYEIYYLAQNASNEESRKVMIRENQNDGNLQSGKLESILINSRIQTESKMLARVINAAFLSELHGLVTGRGVRKADFAVLRGAVMPAVLIEMGYISNRAEAEVLLSKNYREKLAKSLEKAITNFMRKLNQ